MVKQIQLNNKPTLQCIMSQTDDADVKTQNQIKENTNRTKNKDQFNKFIMNYKVNDILQYCYKGMLE